MVIKQCTHKSDGNNGKLLKNTLSSNFNSFITGRIIYKSYIKEAKIKLYVNGLYILGFKILNMCSQNKI